MSFVNRIQSRTGFHVILNNDFDRFNIAYFRIYKRKPVMTTMERVHSAQACKYVDEVVWEDVQLAITKEFIDKQYGSVTSLVLTSTKVKSTLLFMVMTLKQKR